MKLYTPFKTQDCERKPYPVQRTNPLRPNKARQCPACAGICV